MSFIRRSSSLVFGAAVLGLAACSDTAAPPPVTGFLAGTASVPDIASFISSTNKSLVMLQVGDPAQRQEIPLGASAAITPVGFSIRNTVAIVPLGNAASVALVNLETQQIEKIFTFASGNATGSAWVDDSTAIVANEDLDLVGRVHTNRAAGPITETLAMPPFPSGVISRNGRVWVVSSNLDDNFSPAGPGFVTEINPRTMAVVQSVSTQGDNPQYSAFGGDGRLYVVNSGSFGAADGSVTSFNPSGNVFIAKTPGFGDFPGPIAIDAQGRAILSSFAVGSVLWNTQTASFIRGPANALCAAVAGVCRGASDAAFTSNGKILQAFFGSAAQAKPAQLFVYDAATLVLTDSIAVPLGPSGLTIAKFR